MLLSVPIDRQDLVLSKDTPGLRPKTVLSPSQGGLREASLHSSIVPGDSHSFLVMTSFVIRINILLKKELHRSLQVEFGLFRGKHCQFCTLVPSSLLSNAIGRCARGRQLDLPRPDVSCTGAACRSNSRFGFRNLVRTLVDRAGDQCLTGISQQNRS